MTIFRWLTGILSELINIIKIKEPILLELRKTHLNLLVVVRSQSLEKLINTHLLILDVAWSLYLVLNVTNEFCMQIVPHQRAYLVKQTW
jgi:hypothetical protein